jgi:glycosyltransferase involved in cell wall biosynthesis
MRILQVIPFYTSRGGGSVSVAYNLSKELARRGHDITVITSDYEFDDVLASITIAEGVEVIPFRCVLNYAAFLVTPSLRRWLDVNIGDFEVVHLHNYRSYQNLEVSISSTRNHVPYVVQAHGSLARIVNSRTQKLLFDLAWGNKLLRQAKAAIAVTNWESREYERFGVEASAIVEIPNAVEDLQAHAPAVHGTLKSTLGIKEEKKVILYLGRIHKRKGIEHVVEAFDNLRTKRDDSVLVIAGLDDGYGVKLKKLVKAKGLQDMVKFTGFITNASEAYEDSDLVVYPARHEAFGLVPLEAILHGKPVIAAEDIGSGDIIKKCHGGLLVGYGNTPALEEAIVRILDDLDTYKQLALQGGEYIRKELNWKKIADRYERLYFRCADRI